MTQVKGLNGPKVYSPRHKIMKPTDISLTFKEALSYQTQTPKVKQTVTLAKLFFGSEGPHKLPIFGLALELLQSHL